MYGHPIIVNIVAVVMTLPTFFKCIAISAKDEVVELKNDIQFEVAAKKSLLKSYH